MLLSVKLIIFTVIKYFEDFKEMSNNFAITIKKWGKKISKSGAEKCCEVKFSHKNLRMEKSQI